MIFSEYFCVSAPPRQPFRAVSDVFFGSLSVIVLPAPSAPFSAHFCSLPFAAPRPAVFCPVRGPPFSFLPPFPRRAPSRASLSRFRPLAVPLSLAPSHGVIDRARLSLPPLAARSAVLAPSSLYALCRSLLRRLPFSAVCPTVTIIWRAARERRRFSRNLHFFGTKKVPRRKLFGELCSVHVTVK